MSSRSPMKSPTERKSPEDGARRQFDHVIEVAIRAQQMVAGAVLVGGTASSLYAQHRVSLDADCVLPDLRSDFQRVLNFLEQQQGWTTNKVDSPVMILGSLDRVHVGYRQMIRKLPLETVEIETPHGKITVPSLDELICMKAYLAYRRNVVRDFLDFAALSQCTTSSAVIVSLMRSDERYGELQTSSIGMEIAKRLKQPCPYDLSGVDLRHYKSLDPKWHSWENVASVCREFGSMLSSKLILGE